MLRLTEFAGVALRLLTFRRVALAEVPNSPALLAVLWITATAARVLDAVLLASARYEPVSSILHLSGAMLLAALVAAWAIRRRTDAVRLGIVFMIVGLAMALLWLGIEAWQQPGDEAEPAGIVELWIWATATVGTFLWRGQDRVRRGTVLAIASFAIIVVSSSQIASFDGYLMAFSLRDVDVEAAREEYAPIDHETLWPAQPALVEAAAASLTARPGAGPRTLIVTVAAGGAQQIFGREARAALAMLFGRLGPEAQGALLSNARADIKHVPLATNTNLAAVLERAGKGFDSGRDLMVIYLAAHGGRDATLGTNLPGFGRLQPISAQSLVKALDAAGIKRRIVIISACFSGTWIAPLASPDTIVISAAAVDRTSFGCDDSREFTVFGEAFINGSLGHGASLRDAFADLKQRVTEEETRSGATPSLPQAYVGARMQAVWSSSVEQWAARSISTK